jgi:hypothetical protein
VTDRSYDDTAKPIWDELSEIGRSMPAVEPPAPSEPVAWHGLTEGERWQAVSSICEYGTGFVAPLFAVIEGVERTLERRNAAPPPPAAPAVEPMREALQNLLDACLDADVRGDLAGEIDGALLDAAAQALAVPAQPAPQRQEDAQ